MGVLHGYLMYNLAQVKMSVQIGGVMAVFGIFGNVGDWMTLNVDYIAIAMACVAIDHILGTIVHAYYLKDFSWKKNVTGLLIKLSMVMLGGIIFEGLTHITKEQDLVYTYLKITTRLVVCIYPAMSAMVNMRIITGGSFPPLAFLDKFKSFNTDLDVEKLKKGKENERD